MFVKSNRKWHTFLWRAWEMRETRKNMWIDDEGGNSNSVSSNSNTTSRLNGKRRSSSSRREKNGKQIIWSSCGGNSKIGSTNIWIAFAFVCVCVLWFFVYFSTPTNTHTKYAALLLPFTLGCFEKWQFCDLNAIHEPFLYIYARPLQFGQAGAI